MSMTEIDWTPLGMFLPMAFLALALRIMPPSLALGESGQRAQSARGLLAPDEQILLATVQPVMSDVVHVTIGHSEP